MKSKTEHLLQYSKITRQGRVSRKKKKNCD